MKFFYKHCQYYTLLFLCDGKALTKAAMYHLIGSVMSKDYTITLTLSVHFMSVVKFFSKVQTFTVLRLLLMGFVVASSSLTPQCIIIGSLTGFFPVTTADRFTLRNGYGTVEARYHLTAYDCSDPSEVQAYSSVPASHCSTRATPV